VAASGHRRQELLTEPLATRAAEEVSDILIYLVRLADVLEIDLAEAAARKLDGAAARFPAEQFFESAPKKR